MSQLQVTGEAKIRDIQGPVVANDGVITALDGAASQYVRGDGTLADFPTSTGGGSSVSYYLNSSVSQGTIGGVAYRQLSKTPISGAGTDITASTNGYIASYLTDANDPALLEVPAGNFNCEFYFSVNNNTGNPFVYAEVYKYDGTTFTLIGTSVGVPEYINQGTVINPYYFAIPVAQSVLTVTDRIAIRIYVNVDGRTVTLHTENNHLCQVVTTFSKGLTSLNNLTRQVQFLATGTSGTDFNISSSTATHTFNLPVASATNTGKLSSTDWSTFNNKVPYTGAIASVNLGAYSLTATGVTANSFYAQGNGTQGGYLYLKQGITPYSTLTGANSITADGTKYIFFSDAGSSNGKIALFELGSLSNNTNRTYTLPDLSGTLALLEAENIFTDVNSFDFGINYKTDASLANVSGYISQGYAKSGTGSGSTLSLKIADGNSVKAINLDFVGSPATYTYTFPAISGTIALLEGSQTFTGGKTFIDNPIINGTGTNSAYTILQSAGTNKWRIGNNYASGVNTFDIFAYDNSSTPLSINSNGAMTLSANVTTTGAQFVQNGFYLSNANAGARAFYTLMWGSDNGINFALRNGTGGASFIFQSATGYNYTFPAATGTLALTSNLSAYLPLTGGTLTGALSGTSATFSTQLKVSNPTGSALDMLVLETGFNNPSGNKSIIWKDATSPLGRISVSYDAGTGSTMRFGSLYNGGYQTSDLFTIAATGAATFSSSVTANDYLFTGSGAVFQNIASAGTSPIYGYFQNTGGVFYFGRENSAGTEFGVTAYSTVLWNTGNNPIVFATSGSQKMTILGSGNVGIGITSPSRKLDVNGVTRSNAFDIFYNSVTSGFLLTETQWTGVAGANNVSLVAEGGVSGGGNITFFTNGSATERMRITSGGALLVGFTSSGSNKFAVSAGGTTPDLYVNSSGGVGSYSFGTGAIYSNAGVLTNTNPSDERLKENINDISWGLSNILKLRPVSYHWKDDKINQGVQFGFIAQEVQQAMPEAIKEFGNDVKYLGLEKDAIYATLVKAIQELKAEIDELKNKIVALESK